MAKSGTRENHDESQAPLPATNLSISPQPTLPSDRDSLWYRQWAVEHRLIDDIARESGETSAAVVTVVRRVVSRLMREQLDDVMVIRVRQTTVLENAVNQTLKKWNELSDIRFLGEARKLMLDVRKMWGVDKPPRAEVNDDRAQGLGRVAGMSRPEAVRAQGTRLIQMADTMSGQNTTITGTRL